jgi:hypothetical protein
MLCKYYTFNKVDVHGQLVGSSVLKVWFWHTPMDVMLHLREQDKNRTTTTVAVDIRRIK